MASIRTELLNNRLAWKGTEMSQSQDWLYRFSEDALDEIDAALSKFKDKGIHYRKMSAADFQIPTLKKDLARLVNEIDNGRGFVQLKGLRVKNYDSLDAETVFWGIGLHLGDPLSQNPKGELLAHVQDEGLEVTNGNVRGYQTRAGQSFHTDIGGDVVGLMCLRTAKSGGKSRVASSMAVYNELLVRYPHYIGLFYKLYDIDWRGEQPPGGSPVYREPIYAYVNEKLTCRFTPRFIRSAPSKTGIPLSSVEEEAIEIMESLAEELSFDIQFDPGDIQLINNYAILHGRTAYEDHEEPELKRSLFRLWLNLPGPRNLPPAFSNGPARKGVPQH
jgi:hypothetical protein